MLVLCSAMINMYVDDADEDHNHSKPCDVDSTGNSNAGEQDDVTYELNKHN